MSVSTRLARSLAATAVASVCALSGCGPAVSGEGGEGEASETETSDSSTTPSTSGDSASPPATSTPPEPASTTQGPQSTTGSASTSGVTTEDPRPSTGFEAGNTTDTEERACDDEGLYRAIWRPGGLDRVVVYRRDDLSGTCTWITLASPLESSIYDVSPSGGWAVEQASSNDVPSSCDGDDPAADAGAMSLAALHGSIVVDRGGRGSACEVAVTAIAFPTSPSTQRDRTDLCPDPIEIDGC